METAAQVQLVFRGEVLQGFHVEDVKRALGERLRIDEKGLASLFTASHTVLKRAVAPTEAARYIATFAKLGAILHAEGLAPPARPSAGLSLPTIVAPPEDAAPPPPVRSGPPAPAPIPAATRPLAIAATPETPAAADVEEVVCPNCQERQSKRLLCRGCATNIEMALAAKAEADAVARAATLEERQRKYGIKTGMEPVAVTHTAPGLWGLSFHGRLSRLSYWTGGFAVTTVFYLIVIMLMARPSAGRWALFWLGGVLYFLISLRWTAMRLHDLNASGWWSVVLSVPYVGAAASLVLSFVPGTTGDNDYGEPPREGRWRDFGIAVGAFVLVVALTFSTLTAGLLRMYMEEDDGLESLDEPTAAAHTSAEHLLAPGPARNAFETSYTAAPGFKAFASSTSGPWGWFGGAPTLAHATAAAMQHCETQRRSEQAPCEILDASAR